MLNQRHQDFGEQVIKEEVCPNTNSVGEISQRSGVIIIVTMMRGVNYGPKSLGKVGSMSIEVIVNQNTARRTLSPSHSPSYFERLGDDVIHGISERI